MDQHFSEFNDKRMKRTAEALKANRFDAKVVNSREELREKLRELLPVGATCSTGGSMTLEELGVLDFLRSGDYELLDRYAQGADTEAVFHDAFRCRVYFTSANAVTENGELYFMDGRGNRVAAITYGPERIVVIAGYNKIVRDVDEARARNRAIAAPANATRLGIDTPCRHTGRCADCRSPQRICCFELVCHCQMVPNRITVLLINETLGY